jgi:hypothetical protein
VANHSRYDAAQDCTVPSFSRAPQGEKLKRYISISDGIARQLKTTTATSSCNCNTLKVNIQLFQVFEGIPPPYDKKKRMVVPEALRVTRLRPGRRFTNLGRMCSEVGWKHWDTIKTLEAKRKTKSSAFWAKKKEVIQVTSSPHPS